MHSVSVAAAVADASGRLLAVRRRNNGRWEPPGGVLELEETIHDGVVREVLEETSLTVEPEALTGVYKNARRGVVALVLRCRVVDGVAQATAESAEVAWLTQQEVAERMDEAYATRLFDALRPGRLRFAHTMASCSFPGDSGSHARSAMLIDRGTGHCNVATVRRRYLRAEGALRPRFAT
jgi:ADP-ribose pyrophosphatase YjhB (NUDIX family)